MFYVTMILSQKALKLFPVIDSSEKNDLSFVVQLVPNS